MKTSSKSIFDDLIPVSPMVVPPDKVNEWEKASYDEVRVSVIDGKLSPQTAITKYLPKCNAHYFRNPDFIYRFYDINKNHVTEKLLDSLDKSFIQEYPTNIKYQKTIRKLFFFDFHFVTGSIKNKDLVIIDTNYSLVCIKHTSKKGIETIARLMIYKKERYLNKIQNNIVEFNAPLSRDELIELLLIHAI